MYIKTDRLELKPICPESLGSLADLLSDEIVKKTYMVPDFPTREDALKLARRLMDLSAQEERRVAGIYLGENLIGILNQTDATQESIELGYALLPEYHNQGYATEALRGAIGYCFSIGFQEVTAGAFAENPASLRVMIKSGMKEIDRTDEIPYRGKTHTCLYCAIRKEEYHAV